MGSGDWFKMFISRKKTKQDWPKQAKGSASQQRNGSKRKNRSHKGSDKLFNRTSNGNPGDSGVTIEDLAATRIQTAFRSFKARKTLRGLKGIQRLQIITQSYPVQRQTSITLSCVQSWSKLQAQIRACRASMVTEGRIRQRKQDHQMKLEAKLHDLEVEWCGGSETKEEIIARIQQREEAAIRRERAMAYAFSHQWRANSGLNQGYEFGRGDWGWSWVDRWIAVRPWEARLSARSMSPEKTGTKAGSKAGKNTNTLAQKVPHPVKSSASDGKTP